MSRRAIAAAFLLVTAIMSAQSAAAQAARPAGPTTLPPLKYRNIDLFLTAIDIDGEISRILDSYWGPATSALAAANPSRREAAITFARQQRAKEAAIYRPLVAFQIDNRATVLLNPDTQRELEAFEHRRTAEVRKSAASNESRRRVLSAEFAKIVARHASRTDADFIELAKLARSPDGLELRALSRNGLYRCIARFEGPPADNETPASRAQKAAQCAPFRSSPVVKRLQQKPFGAKLIDATAATHVTLAGTVAMGHAAGISLHRLFAAKEVEAAGLTMPDNLSLEQMAARFPQGTTAK